MSGRLALFAPAARLGHGAQMFGKDVANLALFGALVRHGGLDEVSLMMVDPAAGGGAGAGRLLGAGEPGAARLQVTDLHELTAPARAGTLLRGSGKLEELAWMRRHHAGDAAWSLIGLIHTLGPPAIRQDLANAGIAPVQPWDALVCTSPSVRDVVERMFDGWEAHLVDRFGGGAMPRPQLPVIPLGVDGAAFAAKADRPAARAARRAALGMGEDDVLLIWVGRLSYFEKAFPQPMMRAAEEAARATGARVHFAMVGWFPSPEAEEPMYRAAAAAYAPDVAFHIVDGTDRAAVADMWAAADIFVSLVDNVQETFGLTPVEAMAAGVPVVVSDWDGYRYTVEDGVQGFRVPTLVGAPGVLPGGILDGHMLLTKSYQQYAAVIGQHTAVHVGRAAEAMAGLIRSPELRRTMGAAGRRRVAEMLDWRVEAPRYVELSAELAERRAAAGARPHGRRNPSHGDPFADFAGFATHRLLPETRVALRPGVGLADLDRAEALKLDMFAGMWRLPMGPARSVVAALGKGGPTTLGALLRRVPPADTAKLQLTLLWLAKLGVVEWLDD